MKFIKKIYFTFPVLVYLLTYWRTIFYGTAWGDDAYILVPMAKHFSIMLQGFYRNLPGLHFVPFCYFQSYLINSLLGNDAFPFGFHLYAFVLHISSCIIATLILYKITNNRFVSSLIVSLWTVHPINVEILTRLGCIPAQLASGTFCLAFILCFLKAREVKSYIFRLFISLLGILFFFASITSHEQYLPFPLVLLLILFFLDGKRRFFQRDYLLSSVLPIMLIYPVYLTWKFFACGSSLFYTENSLITWTETGSIKDILFRAYWLAPQLLVHYFKLFFYPNFLAESKADWYTVGNSAWSVYSLLCQLIILSLILTSIFLYKKIPLFTVGMVWFFVSMILVIQIIPVFSIIDEHYCYLPILGIFLSIFSFFMYYQKYFSSKLLIALTLLIFSLLTWRTLLYIPSAKDLLSQAIYLAKEAPSWIKPQRISVALDIANSINKTNELPSWLNEETYEREVRSWFKKYLYVKPALSYRFGPIQMPYNYNSYKIFYFELYNKKAFKELDVLIQQALEVKNDWYGWYRNAIFLKEVKQWDEAWQSLKKAIVLAPKTNLLYGLTSFLEIAINANRSHEAEQLIKNYIYLKPKSSHTYLTAGLFYNELHKTEEALNCFKEGIARDKAVSTNDDGLYFFAANLFMKYKMFNEARQALNIILLSIDPVNEKVKNKLQELDYLERKYLQKPE